MEDSPAVAIEKRIRARAVQNHRLSQKSLQRGACSVADCTCSQFVPNLWTKKLCSACSHRHHSVSFSGTPSLLSSAPATPAGGPGASELAPTFRQTPLRSASLGASESVRDRDEAEGLARSDPLGLTSPSQGNGEPRKKHRDHQQRLQQQQQRPPSVDAHADLRAPDPPICEQPPRSERPRSDPVPAAEHAPRRDRSQHRERPRLREPSFGPELAALAPPTRRSVSPASSTTSSASRSTAPDGSFSSVGTISSSTDTDDAVFEVFESSQFSPLEHDAFRVSEPGDKASKAPASLDFC
eukprot:TRINITY_DN4539_c0_g1_i1.p1 TRINITY_DN4539_c0_g1~~TRINITY_DN4539_c0_g1_i1.p1  ORF type:complete len:297 (-),score=82.38 TRINITY_DN4539_c0_g1_i1:318-1208(-)